MDMTHDTTRRLSEELVLGVCPDTTILRGQNRADCHKKWDRMVVGFKN
jgi:hypothetical protein